jgi:hypothetical protein
MSLPQGVSIGPGVSIGAGWAIGIASSPSFTVNSADISSPSPLGSDTYSSISSAGFTSDPGGYIYQMISYNMTSALESTITAAFNTGGIDPGYGYAWNVSWQTGGTGKIRVAINGNGPNSLIFSPIDTADTQWQTGSINGPKQAGTFAFPATFTLYQPATAMQPNNYWC